MRDGCRGPRPRARAGARRPGRGRFPDDGYRWARRRRRSEIGVWEMTPGAMRDTEADEVFVVLVGRGDRRRSTIRALPSIELGPGSVVRLAAGHAHRRGPSARRCARSTSPADPGAVSSGGRCSGHRHPEPAKGDTRRALRGALGWRDVRGPVTRRRRLRHSTPPGCGRCSRHHRRGRRGRGLQTGGAWEIRTMLPDGSRNAQSRGPQP